MRTLALDFGSKRIGLALSDPEGIIASPQGVLKRGKLEDDLTSLADMVKKQQVAQIVIGLPVHMNGSQGKGVSAVKRFAEVLQSRVTVPIDFFDERLTSVEASRALRESGYKGKKNADKVDSVAAAILLRAYLASRESKQR